MVELKSGSCFCGAVCYSFEGKIQRCLNCHCPMCRSLNGGSFSTYIVVKRDNFSIHNGEEHVKGFQVTERSKKHFCSKCGTPIYNLNDRFPGTCIIHYGTLKNAKEIIPRMNIYFDRSIPWISSIREFVCLGGETGFEKL